MIARVALCGILVWIAMALPTAAQNRQPLLMDGKKTLFQKVLTRPGASLATAIGGDGTTPLPPFSVLYIYAKHPVDGGGPTYLEVGRDAKGRIEGFLPEKDVVPWDHALVLAFTDRAQRDRVLFLRDEADLNEWTSDPNLAALGEKARRQADARALPDDSPVVSIEPKTPVDFAKQFYMLPVLEAKPKRLPNRKRAMAVRIASVTRDDEAAKLSLLNTRENESADDGAPGVPGEFRTGVVFVIDASSSMQPYIEQTREVMVNVLKQVKDAGLQDKVRYGVVAYRDDPEEVSGIEYLAKTFADPNEIDESIDFLAAVQPLSASKVSTRAFAEDAFSGIDHALTRVKWDDFGARYIVLITDASARDRSTQPQSKLRMNVDELRIEALASTGGYSTSIYVLHLMTPVGRKDHDRARAQYQALTRSDSGRNRYFGVKSGDENEFASQVSSLATSMIRNVDIVSSQFQAALDADSPEDETDKKLLEALDKAFEEEFGDSPEDQIRKAAAEDGRAMALAWLGRQQGSQAPPMFEAWSLDKDFADPRISSFSVRLLLSKNQLSDLQRTMTATIDALDAGQLDPSDFFNQLRSAASAMGRDPDTVGQGKVKNLATSGLLGEYLEGLPFQSTLMDLTEDDWVRMSPPQQQELIDDVNSKIRLYQRFHDDTSKWIPLNEGDDPGDFVYPVPLDALP